MPITPCSFCCASHPALSIIARRWRCMTTLGHYVAGAVQAGVNCKRHCLLSVASTIDRWTFYACEMTSLDYWLFVLRSGIELNYVCGSHSTAIWYSSWWCDVTYTVFQKRQMPNSWRQLCYLSTDFQFFSTIRFSNKFTAKYLLNTHHTSYASLHYLVKH